MERRRSRTIQERDKYARFLRKGADSFDWAEVDEVEEFIDRGISRKVPDVDCAPCRITGDCSGRCNSLRRIHGNLITQGETVLESEAASDPDLHLRVRGAAQTSPVGTHWPSEGTRIPCSTACCYTYLAYHCSTCSFHRSSYQQLHSSPLLAPVLVVVAGSE